MQKWTNYFDAIYLINLESRTERLLISLRRLHWFDIPVQVFDAIYNERNGAVGLRSTMIALFTECLHRGYNNVLIFEDDFMVLEDLNFYMPLCLQQLPKDFSLLYLGGHIITPFKEKYSENLLTLTGALTTHAIVYSRKAIEILLPIFIAHAENPRDKTTIDMLLSNRIITAGKSYITYPLLVSQRKSWSDIENREIDYKDYIEDKYERQYQKLLL